MHLRYLIPPVSASPLLDAGWYFLKDDFATIASGPHAGEEIDFRWRCFLDVPAETLGVMTLAWRRECGRRRAALASGQERWVWEDSEGRLSTPWMGRPSEVVRKRAVSLVESALAEVEALRASFQESISRLERIEAALRGGE